MLFNPNSLPFLTLDKHGWKTEKYGFGKYGGGGGGGDGPGLVVMFLVEAGIEVEGGSMICEYFRRNLNME